MDDGAWYVCVYQPGNAMLLKTNDCSNKLLTDSMTSHLVSELCSLGHVSPESWSLALFIKQLHLSRMKALLLMAPEIPLGTQRNP